MVLSNGSAVNFCSSDDYYLHDGHYDSQHPPRPIIHETPTNIHLERRACSSGVTCASVQRTGLCSAWDDVCAQPDLR